MKCPICKAKKDRLADNSLGMWECLNCGFIFRRKLERKVETPEERGKNFLDEAEEMDLMEEVERQFLTVMAGGDRIVDLDSI